MPDKTALDLSAIDPPIWRVMVNDSVYGPYTLGQMQAFCEEGRLRDTSKVAHGDGGAFVPAFQHETLRRLLQPEVTRSEPTADAVQSNYLITLQTDEDGRTAAISVLNEAGQFSELMPGNFILETALTVIELRTQLSTVLAERGRCIIVNARTGQLAWMGLGPDADAHAKLIWTRGD
jgi:hypothetical protein